MMTLHNPSAPYTLPAVLELAVYCATCTADDAESCCGSPRFSSNTHQLSGSLEHLPRQQSFGVAEDDSCCDTACNEQLSHDSLKQAAMLHHHSPRSDTEMGDDFAALDASLLLDDFNIQDGYQGGVEEALADWQAAVSVGPVVTGDQEADSSSSCCNCPYHSNALAPQQQPAGVSWHQQLTQQWQPRQSCAAAPAAQTTCLPAPCTWACATQQQQQQQLCNSNNRQQQQGAPATAPAPASASAAACPYAAFKGDVVGAVLAGLVPPPGSNSSDAASWGAVVDMHLEAPAAACF